MKLQEPTDPKQSPDALSVAAGHLETAKYYADVYDGAHGHRGDLLSRINQALQVLDEIQLSTNIRTNEDFTEPPNQKDFLCDPAWTHVMDALAHDCAVCPAGVGQFCIRVVSGERVRDRVHLSRLLDESEGAG